MKYKLRPDLLQHSVLIRKALLSGDWSEVDEYSELRNCRAIATEMEILHLSIRGEGCVTEEIN